ncbi:hypothetical protein SK128_013640, partial [Halocaridina rubra]
MAECEGVQTLSSLCFGGALKYVQGLFLIYLHSGAQTVAGLQVRDAVQSIPPNFHGEFLDKLAPYFDSITADKCKQCVLDLIDELVMILLSPSILYIDVDRFKFPTRNPAKYLKGLESAKTLQTFISQKENVWKYSVNKFKLLTNALSKMSMLRHLTLRHVRIPSGEISALLESLASNSPLLAFLDLKYSTISDSGLDTSVIKKFGNEKKYVDCIPSLLKMKSLRHLDVSESWLTYCGIKSIVQSLALERLDAIVNDCYDLQGVVIKDLMADPQDAPLALDRRGYNIAQEEQYVQEICKACPLLENVIIQHCHGLNINRYFSALSELNHLCKITLCGLEWTLDSQMPLHDEPQVISRLVKEITLQDPSDVSAFSLGVLSICFPEVTHLWILGSQDAYNEPWDRGRVFTKLTHVHYKGSLACATLERIE